MGQARGLEESTRARTAEKILDGVLKGIVFSPIPVKQTCEKHEHIL